ncbi:MULTISPECIES: hypothetical protein [unclassified Streptomyces]|uniref:hypothetical protein n=1 Tax=unclassified Streptomyces TaxID=2593676 RepID=UPI000A9AEC33|nr:MULTISPECIES: hypothetical protein [unclassified Streptomyces]
MPEHPPIAGHGLIGDLQCAALLDYVEALARAGRLDHARYAMDKMLTYAAERY